MAPKKRGGVQLTSGGEQKVPVAASASSSAPAPSSGGGPTRAERRLTKKSGDGGGGGDDGESLLAAPRGSSCGEFIWVYINIVWGWFILGSNLRFIFNGSFPLIYILSILFGIVAAPFKFAKAERHHSHWAVLSYWRSALWMLASGVWLSVTSFTSPEFQSKITAMGVGLSLVDPMAITLGETDRILNIMGVTWWLLGALLQGWWLCRQFTGRADFKLVRNPDAPPLPTIAALPPAVAAAPAAAGAAAAAPVVGHCRWSHRHRRHCSPQLFDGWTRRLLVLTLVWAFGMNSVADYRLRSCTLELGKEGVESAQFTPEVEHKLADLVRSNVEAGAHVGFDAVDNHNAHRLAHENVHGCVRGTFLVDTRLPKRMRVGTFAAEGQSYPAWVRFSSASGKVQSDSIDDSRGMAVKLMGVTASPKLLNSTGFGDDATEQYTHDLLAVSESIFPVTDALTYDQFLASRKAGSPALAAVLYTFPVWWNPLTWRVRFAASMLWIGRVIPGDENDTSLLTLQWATRAIQKVALVLMSVFRDVRSIYNPLSAVYYSATPYSYGNIPNRGAVKYKFQPCRTEVAGVSPRSIDDQSYSNRWPHIFLRENMRRQLNDSDACFDFYVQEQYYACAEPVEDPSVAWTADWVHVGVLTIPKQQFLARDQVAFCDALSYNPWHAPVAHRPLGAINRARKLSYAASARTRRAINGESNSGEPTGKEEFVGPQLPVPTAPLGRPDLYQYSEYAEPNTLLPRKIKDWDLVANEHFSHAKFTAVNKIAIADLLNFGHQILFDNTKAFEEYTTPQDYQYVLADHLWAPDAKRIFASWTQDSEFARSFLSGVNPMSIHDPYGLDGKLPAGFKPNATDLARLAAVADGASIEQLLSERRLYYAEYDILKDIDMTKGRIFYTPIIMLFVKHMPGGTRQLMPLCIQLTQNTLQPNRIFTPPPGVYDPYRGDGLVWLFARMHAISADAQYHEMISHLLFTHLAMEPIIVGFHRHFPASHPLLNVMLPHFVDTLAINNFGRHTLLADAVKSFFEHITSVGIRGSTQLMELIYRKSWSLAHTRVPFELKERGFTYVDPDLYGPSVDRSKDPLPNYLYAEYASMVWKATRGFITDVVEAQYGNDAAVVNDVAIQNLMNELYDPEGGALPFDDVRPKETIHTRDALIQFLTGILYTCSAQHSAVNFGQEDYYSFIPNRPLHLNLPMPDDLSRVDMAYVMKALPQKLLSQETILIAKTLVLTEPTSLLTDVENQNGLFGYYDHFPEASNEFLKALRVVNATITKRNTEVSDAVFPYLLPSRIMPSISI